MTSSKDPKAALCDSNDFTGSLMHVIHSLYIGIQKRLEHVLSLSGQISFSQFVILSGFASCPESTVSQVKLAEHLMLTEATVSRHISILVTKKLLKKEAGLVNKKSNTVSVTADGMKKYNAAKKVIMEELQRLFVTMSPKDTSTILTSFSKIIVTLQQKK